MAPKDKFLTNLKKLEAHQKGWKNEAKNRKNRVKNRLMELIQEGENYLYVKKLQNVIPAHVGARNPYALANAINKETIPWSDIENKRTKLEEIFSPVTMQTMDKPIKYRQLFDPAHGSPLFPKRIKKPTRKRFPQDSIETPRSAPNFVMSKCGDSQRPWVTDCGSLQSLQWNNNHNLERFQTTNVPLVRVDAPIQGCPPDCWLISALSSVAWTDSWPIEGVGDYLEIDDFQQSKFISANPPEDTVPYITDANQNAIPAYAFSKFSETWPATFELYMAALVEKKINIGQNNWPDIAAIGTGDPHYAGACITLNELNPDSRRTAPYPNDFDANNVWNEIDGLCQAANASFRSTTHPMVAWTYCTGSDTSDEELASLGCTDATRAPTAIYSDEILVASHAYSILGTMIDDGLKYVILRNPWGGAPDNQGGYCLYAPANPQYYHLADPCSIYLYPYDYDGNATHDYLEPLVNGKRPVRDGIFGLRSDDFARFFAGFAWV
jgi:hypothetical protein